MAAGGKAAAAPLEIVRAVATTKQSVVLAMLRSAEGATLDAIMTQTGWQSHSVRGFLSGVVRRKLGLSIVSERHGDQRIYRIASGEEVAKPAKPGSIRRR